MRKRGVLLFAAALLAGCTRAPAGDEADLLILGGTVVDGTGAERRRADVAVSAGRISFVGDAAQAGLRAANTVDATGLIVAPGFIDPHTHAREDLVSDHRAVRANRPYLFQGVTTVAIGNDGHGSYEIARQAQAARASGVGTNVAYLAGFGGLRKAVVGEDDVRPTTAQVEEMSRKLTAAFCEGARGFSTGLYYTPQAYSETGEVASLAKVAARFGGYYDTHLRDESTYNVGLDGAVGEALEIGDSAGLPVHIAHIKALGPATWGHSAKIIAMVEAARARGQQVTADQYPYEASGTRISNALVPKWALSGGLADLRDRLKDEDTAERIRAEMAENLERRGGAERLLITAPLGGTDVAAGQTLADLAEAMSTGPVEAAVSVLKDGDARVASFNMNADDIRAFAVEEWVMTGSDGSTGHPRKYGSFPQAYRDFVVDGQQMTLERFVQRSSAMAADLMGLADRGRLEVGKIADIVAFDPASFRPRSTFAAPTELAEGVNHLWIGGESVIADREWTGTLAGQPLLKPSSDSLCR